MKTREENTACQPLGVKLQKKKDTKKDTKKSIKQNENQHNIHAGRKSVAPNNKDKYFKTKDTNLQH